MKQLILITRTTLDHAGCDCEYHRFFSNAVDPFEDLMSDIKLTVISGHSVMTGLDLNQGVDHLIPQIVENISSFLDPDATELTIAIHRKDQILGFWDDLKTVLEDSFQESSVFVNTYGTGNKLREVEDLFGEIAQGNSKANEFYRLFRWDRSLEAKLELLEKCLMPGSVSEETFPEELARNEQYLKAFGQFLAANEAERGSIMSPFDSRHMKALQDFRDALLDS